MLEGRSEMSALGRALHERLAASHLVQIPLVTLRSKKIIDSLTKSLIILILTFALALVRVVTAGLNIAELGLDAIHQISVVLDVGPGLGSSHARALALLLGEALAP